MTTRHSMTLHTLPLGGMALRLASGAWRQALALVRAVIHRRDVRLLLEMDDRALKDIGLVRNDVLGALAEPLMKDPSTVLLVRSVERRVGRHAVRMTVRP